MKSLVLCIVPLLICVMSACSEEAPKLQIEESLYQIYQKSASAVVTISGSTEDTVLKATLLRDGSETPLSVWTTKSPFRSPVQVSFDLSKRPKETYFIKVELLRGEDVLATRQSRALPYNPSPKIGFDKDGFLTVSGKPYFPIGMYTLQDGKGDDHDRVLKEAREAGFNTTVFYAYTVPTVTPLLDAAARQGIKAFVYPTIPFPVRKKTLSDGEVVKDVLARIDHPALLGWYVVDEPEGIGKAASEVVRDLYQLIKETDTNHPCSLVIMSPDAGVKYRMCADVIWTDPYPIPSRPASYVADVVKGCVNGMTDGNPVWAVPQAFDWSVWNSGKINGEHRPTPAEERCMTYLSLVHGAKGIIYWAHYGSKYYIEDYPDHWKYMKKLAGEMRDLSPVLLTVNAKRAVQVSPKEAPLDTMVKELNGQVYLFAVNREPKACSATLRLDGITSKRQVEVLFEDRKVQSANGTWKDEFKPLEAHVYRLSAK